MELRWDTGVVHHFPSDPPSASSFRGESAETSVSEPCSAASIASACSEAGLNGLIVRFEFRETAEVEPRREPIPRVLAFFGVALAPVEFTSGTAGGVLGPGVVVGVGADKADGIFHGDDAGQAVGADLLFCPDLCRRIVRETFSGSGRPR